MSGATGCSMARLSLLHDFELRQAAGCNHNAGEALANLRCCKSPRLENVRKRGPAYKAGAAATGLSHTALAGYLHSASPDTATHTPR